MNPTIKNVYLMNINYITVSDWLKVCRDDYNSKENKISKK